MQKKITKVLKKYIKVIFLSSLIYCVDVFAVHEDLAQKAQNPVSNLISLPFQNNMNFKTGPDDDIQNILNIQPVLPYSLNSNWSLITRAIIPVISQPYLGHHTFGLGDTNLTFFLSPAKNKTFFWGAGPEILFPTATDKVLGAGKWGIGPSLVVLHVDSTWVYGALINNVWSFTGRHNRSEVNNLLLQPFLNYNFPSKWYLTTAPIITANWKEKNRNRWVIPLGGGFGKIFSVGKQPMNFQVQAFGNIKKPDIGPAWTLRLQMQFLFPEG
jgi:hypothetical protein